MRVEDLPHANQSARYYRRSVAGNRRWLREFDEYIFSLIERDKERVAIQEGLDAMRQGRLRPFDEFDAEFRQERGIRPIA